MENVHWFILGRRCSKDEQNAGSVASISVREAVRSPVDATSNIFFSRSRANDNIKIIK